MNMINHKSEASESNAALNTMIIKEVPLVSVIIPVYNREELIINTLENIRENKYRPLEVILINDGSTDDSLLILKEYKEKFHSDDFRIKVINQENQGAPVARNLGYDHSTGEYIQFLDSDDMIAKEKFQIQTQMMEKYKADFGLCDFESVYPKEQKKIYQSNSKKLDKILHSWGSFGCGSPLLKRRLAKKIRWNEDLNRQQDVDFFLRAALLANSVAYVNRPLYYYINHDKARISDCYTKTDPVYFLRIKSLIPILKYNFTKTFRAISNLIVRVFYYYSFRYLKFRRNTDINNPLDI